jgi:nicotinate-nucleotide adenylyltransferase
MKKTGLFFGSFNPIHIGHLIVAGYMQQFTDLNEIWFVVSPHNPLKEKQDLLDDQERLAMVKLAIDNNPVLGVSEIEFTMPRPSYTIDTLTQLESLHPDRKFIIIAGTDIFEEFFKWKDYRLLLQNRLFYIYNRPDFEVGEFAKHPAVRIFKAPLLDISSTFIRQAIGDGKDVRYMLPEKVWKYICLKGHYQK